MADSRAIDVLMRMQPVIPVITIERPEHAEPLAAALVRGGLRVLEVTLRTPAALGAIRAMGRVEGAVVGAGTVLSAADVDRAAEAGARFIVTPGLAEGPVRAAAHVGLPILPGVASASEIMAGLDFGLDRFKFFPAEPAGGVAMLKAFAGPFGAVKFCPTGGISAASAPAYLALPNVICVGGGWVCPPALMEAGDWAGIEALARAAAAMGR